MEDGSLSVQLDRRGERRLVPYRAPEWILDREPEATPIQLARLMHSLDRELRILNGSYSNTLIEWVSLKDPERMAWLNRARWQPVLAQLKKHLGL